MNIPKGTQKFLKRHDIKVSEFRNSLVQCQKILGQEIPKISAVPLGQQYSSMSAEECQYNLALARLKKKFVVPAECDKELRRITSIKSMLTYDAEGIKTFNPHTNIGDPMSKWILYRARAVLGETFKKFRMDYTNFTFPSNKVHYALGDDVSLEQKLYNKDCWEVTLGCVDMFCRIAYHNLWFKRIAKQHIGAVTRDERKLLWEKYRSFKNCGYLVFKALLIKYVLIIIHGGRISTVPKNNEVDRVIIVEPFCNMCVQRCIALNLIKAGNKTEHFKINLADGKAFHQMMIADYQNATVDFLNASNSVFTAVIKWLWPKSVVSKLCSARSEHASYKEGDEIHYHPLTMLSAMGNGFTFEVMTLTLLAISRVIDTGAMVFGDDVIIDKDVAKQFIDACSYIGFKTNDAKTFLDGDFRESCGGFISHGKYLKSFDFEYPENWFDLCVCINKLRVLAIETKNPWLSELHRRLRDTTPVVAWSVAPDDLNLLEGSIFVDKKFLLRKRRADTSCRKIYQDIGSNVRTHYVTDLQYQDVNNFLQISRRSRCHDFDYGELVIGAVTLFEPGSNGCKSRIFLELPWFPSSSTDEFSTTDTVDQLKVAYEPI